MKPTMWVLSFFLVASLAGGCTPTDETSTMGSKEVKTGDAQLKSAESRTKDAARAIQDYAYEQKAEFLVKMNMELSEIEKELDRLDARVNASSGAANAEAKAELEAVRTRWAQAKRQLALAESADDSTWDSVKDGFRKSYGELKDSFEKTRQWVSDKLGT